MYFKTLSLLLVINAKIAKTNTSFLSFFSLARDILWHNSFFSYSFTI